MTADHKIEFNPNPTQDAFIRSEAKADLFSSRVGEGKSAALCWSCYHHTMHNPGAPWALIRDTWTNMEATTQKEFFHWFPPGILGDYVSSTRTFKWTAERMGLIGEVQFLGLDDPNDASKLQSRTLAGFGIDEPAPAAESGGVSELIFDIGLSRLRFPGMKWYAAKLAQNNPDETHWTYRRFVDPGTPGFVNWQTKAPENERNLPDDYYEGLKASWAHRPDLVRRFIEGKYGFQQIGKSVTPEWADNIHLTRGLKPIPRYPTHLLWDFGLNPTCIITQVTPQGAWHILEAHVGSGIGVEELIDQVVKTRLADSYRRCELTHIGDPQGTQREQSSSQNTAVRVIRKLLGGTWRAGPRDIDSRVNPLRAVLRRNMIGGHGVVQVDRDNAKAVWHALRGGWHRNISRTGIVGEIAKDEHSHPGDAMGYGAAVLFPLSKIDTTSARNKRAQTPGYGFGGSGPLGFERPGLRLPANARVIS